MSIILFNYLYFVVSQYSKLLNPSKKYLIILKLSLNKIFWGFIIGSVIYFLIGFVIPAYIIALLQQLYFAPSNINYLIYFQKLINGLFGFIVFWTVLSVLVLKRYRSEFSVLVIIFFLYIFLLFANIYTGGKTFNQFWIMDLIEKNISITIIYSILFWIFLNTLCFFVGKYISSSIQDIDLTLNFQSGFFSKLAKKINNELSSYHLNMMGLVNQKILFFFTFMGLILLIPLLIMPNKNLFTLAKIYIGAIVPILFSFNQHYLINIDRQSGMIYNNFLRKISYSRIILNRWLIILIPQLLTVTLYAGIISIFVKPISISIYLYFICLNILCSKINLFFSTFSRSNTIANIFLLFFVYIQLRNDFVQMMMKIGNLQIFNVFYPLLQDSEPLILNWLILFILIFILFFLIIKLLVDIKYVKLEMP